MAIAIDKEQLIEAIRGTDDERILFAISRLLQLEGDIPDWHENILKQRLSDIEEGKAIFHDWNSIKVDLFNTK